MSAQKSQEKIYYKEEGMDAPQGLHEEKEMEIIIGSERKIRQLKSDKKKGEEQLKCSGEELGKGLFSKSKQQKSQGSLKKQNLFERGNGVNILAQSLNGIKPIMENLMMITNGSSKKESSKKEEQVQDQTKSQQNDPEIIKESEPVNDNAQQVNTIQIDNAIPQVSPILNQSKTNPPVITQNQVQPIPQSSGVITLNSQVQVVQTLQPSVQIQMNAATNPQEPLSRKSTQADENDNNNIPSQASASKTSNFQQRTLAQ